MFKAIFLFINFIFFSAQADATQQLSTSYNSPLIFTEEVNNYLTKDKKVPVAKYGVVITGSSSVRFWQPQIHDDFTKINVIARGFGGSNMNDLLYFSKELITQYKPRAVAIYEGDNDIAQGIQPNVILQKFIALIKKIKQKLPDIRVYFISIKPSIARESMWPRMVETNLLIQKECEIEINCTYIDVSSKLLRKGLPKQGIYIADGLHLNKKGYQLWSSSIVPVIENVEANKKR